MMILETDRLAITFGGVRAIDGVSISIASGQVFSIIGPNGSGKTTLFNLVSGIYTPNDGSIRLAGETVTGLAPDQLARRGLSRTFQNLQIFSRMTVLENVMVGRHRHERTGILADLLHWPTVARQNRATREAALAALGASALPIWLIARPAAAYGALAARNRASASEPSVLLLTSGRRLQSVETQDITSSAPSCRAASPSLVGHDMRLVMNISDRCMCSRAPHRSPKAPRASAVQSGGDRSLSRCSRFAGGRSCFRLRTSRAPMAALRCCTASRCMSSPARSLL